jgi:hypothetical protein
MGNSDRPTLFFFAVIPGWFCYTPCCDETPPMDGGQREKPE